MNSMTTFDDSSVMLLLTFNPVRTASVLSSIKENFKFESIAIITDFNEAESEIAYLEMKDAHHVDNRNVLFNGDLQHAIKMQRINGCKKNT